MKTKLIKAKILIETEIVVENFYNEDPVKCATSSFLANRNDMVTQAIEVGEFKILDVKELKTRAELPLKWDLKSLPWLPNINFGDKEQHKENTIETFLKK